MEALRVAQAEEEERQAAELERVRQSAERQMIEEEEQ